MQTDTEYKQNQPEVLYEREDRRVSGKSEVSDQNPDKQDKSNPQRNAEELNFSQQDTYRYNKGIKCNDMGYRVRIRQ